MLSCRAEEETQPLKESDDWAIVLVDCLCAFCISIIGLIIGYYAQLEDRLMYQYQLQGIAVSGEVRSAERTRRKIGDEVEYRADVRYRVGDEHDCEEANHASMVICKEVKVLGNDFRTETPGCRSSQHDMCVDMSIIHMPSKLKPRALDLIVLPSSPRSALPKKQLERVCSLRFRMPIYLLVTILFAATTFFVFLAMQNLPKGLQEETKRGIVWGALSGLFVAEILGVHYCFRNCLDKSLEEEYLEGTEVQSDDTTISTMTSMVSLTPSYSLPNGQFAS